MTYTRVRDHRESLIGNPPFLQVNVTLSAGVSAQADGAVLGPQRDRSGHHRAERRTMLKGHS
jgi:hypothetical protein